MRDLPDVTVLQILAALPYTVIANVVVRVCRDWHALRSSEPFLAARAEVGERGLVVAGGVDWTGRKVKLCRVLIGGRWRERAPLPYFIYSSTSFRGELVLFGSKRHENGLLSPSCLAFNLKANAWRTLEWPEPLGETDDFVWDCCATDSVVVAQLSITAGDRYSRLCSLRPRSAEGWVSIPDPPDVDFEYVATHSFCCVEDVLYIVGGMDESSATSDALKAFDLSTRAWARRAPIPEPRCDSVCVQLAGRLYVLGGCLVDVEGDDHVYLTSVFSYDPRTDRWRSESPLPLVEGSAWPTTWMDGMRAVTHEGRVVVIGLDGAPPLALMDDVWTELPHWHRPPGRQSYSARESAGMASLLLA